MPESRSKKSPRDILRIILRRRYLFLGGFACFAITVLLGSYCFMPVKYTGTAMLQVGLQTGTEQISAIRTSFKKIRETFRFDLAGQNAVAEAVETLGLTRGLPHGKDGRLTEAGERARQEKIASIIANTRIRTEERSDYEMRISVSFTDSDPALAEQMPTTLIKGYIERVYEDIRRTLKSTRDFYADKVARATKAIDELRRQRIEFETRHAGQLPDDPKGLQDRIQRISSEIDSLKMRKTLAKQKIAMIRGHLQTTTAPASQEAPIMVPNPRIPELKEELRQTEEALADATEIAGMTEKHPTVMMLRRKVEQLRKRLEEEPAEVVFGTIPMGAGQANKEQLTAEHLAAQSELTVTSNELVRLEKLLATYEELWRNFGPVRQEYLRLLERERAEQSKADWYRNKLEEADAALQAELEDRSTLLRQVQRPQRQFAPSEPTITKIFGLAVVGGLMFGGALVFVAGFIDRSFATTEEAAQALEIPIHGVIGEIVTPRERRRRRLLRWVLGPIVSVIVIGALAAASLNVVLWLRYPGMTLRSLIPGIQQSSQAAAEPVSASAGQSP